MHLTPASINAWRGVVRWMLRGLAVVLTTSGVYLLLKRVLFGFGAGWRMIMQAWTDIESHSFYRGAAMIAVGLALAALSTRLSRWIVSVPPQGCPRCGYSQAPQPGTRCSECGLGGGEEPDRGA